MHSLGSAFNFRRVIGFDLELGESPIWDDRRSLLWFADITANKIYAASPEGGDVIRHDMPAAVCSFGLADDDRLIVALRTGIHLYRPEDRALRFVCQPEPDRPAVRLNDGKVSPDGAFWVGSMSELMPRARTGALYRISPDGAFSKVCDDLHVSNGLAWSPSGDVLYHADSRGIWVSRWDFDPRSGEASNRRILIELTERQGLPDGAAVDVEGNYWSAGVTAGCLNRISPAGDILQTIALPMAAPTMPCFGGKDLETMFVTSLTTDRLGRPQPGTVIAFEPGVRGIPVHRFHVGESLRG